MLVEQKEKLQTLIGLVDKIEVNPDVNVEYFIPGVLVSADGGEESGNPYIRFIYSPNGLDPHVQNVPLTRSYLEKTPQDLKNIVTSSLERFMEEIDSRQYGAQ